MTLVCMLHHSKAVSEMPSVRTQKHLALRPQHKRAWRRIIAVLPSNTLLRAVVMFGTGKACQLVVWKLYGTPMPHAHMRIHIVMITKDCCVAGAAVLCCMLVCGFVLHMHMRWYMVNALAGASLQCYYGLNSTTTSRSMFPRNHLIDSHFMHMQIPLLLRLMVSLRSSRCWC